MGSARRLKRSEQLAPAARYELLARLAAGGMGAVYVARSLADDGDGALVAVKRAHEHLLDDNAFREMFVAEARLASRIHHPNVVAVREAAEVEGELLIVMEYVEAASFADVLTACLQQHRRLPPAVTIRVILDAAAGLHAAHSVRDDSGRLLGMVHRDVSPHNVLCGVDGAARIVDFGVAKAIEHEGTNTQTGVLKGKSAYMAPEYLKKRKASPESDVFSLAIVAWEGLAMRRLFRAEDEVTTMQRILSPDPATRLSDVMSIEPAIEAVIAKALSKEPRDRYASAAEFAEALSEAARAADEIASPGEVGALVESVLGKELDETRAVVREALEQSAAPRSLKRRGEERTLVRGVQLVAQKAAPRAERIGGGTVAMNAFQEAPALAEGPDDDELQATLQQTSKGAATIRATALAYSGALPLPTPAPEEARARVDVRAAVTGPPMAAAASPQRQAFQRTLAMSPFGPAQTPLPLAAAPVEPPPAAQAFYAPPSPPATRGTVKMVPRPTAEELRAASAGGGAAIADPSTGSDLAETVNNRREKPSRAIVPLLLIGLLATALLAALIVTHLHGR